MALPCLYFIYLVYLGEFRHPRVWSLERVQLHLCDVSAVAHLLKGDFGAEVRCTHMQLVQRTDFFGLLTLMLRSI